MVHTRHSFAESLQPKRHDDPDQQRTSEGRRNIDETALVNGASSGQDERPRKRRKAYDDMAIPYHEYVTRNSARSATRSSVRFHGQLSSSKKSRGRPKRMLEQQRSDTEEIRQLADSFSEPRRSARQRREVYGTLNETLIAKTITVEKKKEDEDEENGESCDYGEDEDDEDRESEEEEEGSDDAEDEEDEEEEDQGSQERPYSFREKRTATRRYSAPPISGKSRKREAFYNVIPHSPMHTKRHRRMPQHSFPDSSRRRKHYGSSTSSSDSDDERRFERRKAKSMAKARARCLPMNLKPSDVIGVLKDRERARERNVIGTSLADVDPMTIDNKVTFGSVGGLDKHIRSLKEMVVFPLLYPEVFEKFRIAPPRGVLFYGPPGTGKTLVARALANECSSEQHKVSFFMRKGADCLSKWVGESERQLRLLFDQAYSMRPSIIFFDEIDGLAPVRSTRQDQIHSSIVSTLLALMDGLDSRGEVIVIGATNRIDSIDPALRRPGRFDREFLFTLPNKVARRRILEIHTKEWQPKISKAFCDELADQCVGYCGADIKALCTEAALVALRRRYPQIYGTNKKLVLDTNDIKISAKDFQYAMKKIVPASQRSVAAPGQALNQIMKPLLESTLELILEKIRRFFPAAKAIKDTNTDTGNNASRSQSSYEVDPDFSDDDYDDDNQPSIYEPLSYGRSTRTTQRASSPPPANTRFLDLMNNASCNAMSHRARFIITGPEGMGQSTHIAPALLYSMEHLKVYVLDLPALFGVSARVPEEACSQIFTEARRTAPCVIYVPHIDAWWNSISETCKCTFLQLLDDLPASLSIILISTCNVMFTELPDRVKRMFSPVYDEVYEVANPTEEQRRAFFHELLLTQALEEPIKPKPCKAKQTLEVLPVAPAPQKRQLSEAELKNLREQEQNILRELRLFLRQVVWKLMADRKFKEFLKPVDLDEVPDYLDVIKQPMDLSTIMTKINSHQYQTCAQFLKDVDLITNNCLEYNPDQDTFDRLLRNRVCELRDTAHAMIYADLDPEFEKMCEEIAVSRQERNDSEDVFAPSYIRVLQKNSHPLRSSTSNANQADSQASQPSTATDNSALNTATKRHPQPYNEGATRHSRRIRGEESVEIPSFSMPIENIIRSAEKKRRRGHSVRSESMSNADEASADITSKDKTEFDENTEVCKEIPEQGTDEQQVETSMEEKTVNNKAIPDEEKPCKEDCFVVLNRECNASDVANTDIPAAQHIENSPEPSILIDGQEVCQESPQIIPQEDTQSPKDEPMQLAEDSPDRESCKASKSLNFDEIGVQSSENVDIEKDKKHHREALESLLHKLVLVTESESITSLEKIYFNISNCIYRNRKEADKTIVIKEISNFIGLLEEQRN